MKTVWIIDPEQWPRALLRAELIDLKIAEHRISTIFAGVSDMTKDRTRKA